MVGGVTSTERHGIETTEQRDERPKLPMQKNISHAVSAVPRGRCSFCVYELPHTSRGPCPVVPRATRVLVTANGNRDVCDKHAAIGRWAS